jgi:hypothetical protein
MFPTRDAGGSRWFGPPCRQCSLWTGNVPRNIRFILAAVCHRVVDDVDGSVALLLTALDDTRSIRNARATQTKRADNEHGENDLGA